MDKGQPSAKLMFQPDVLNTSVSIDYEDIPSASSEVGPQERKGNLGGKKHEKKQFTFKHLNTRIPEEVE